MYFYGDIYIYIIEFSCAEIIDEVSYPACQWNTLMPIFKIKINIYKYSILIN